MSEKPILFSAPMVRAILDGRKTQTRRLLKPRKDRNYGCALAPCELAAEINGGDFLNSPYQPGDRLWVRETHALEPSGVGPTRVVYAAGGEKVVDLSGDLAKMSQADRLWTEPEHYRPSIHMPRWASRITLEVTEVRVQRLQDISASDSIAEGVVCETCDALSDIGCYRVHCYAARKAYGRLWNSLHGPAAWDANPWVMAITFKHLPAGDRGDG